MRISFTRQDGPADFEIMSEGAVIISEIAGLARSLVVKHADGSQLAIYETDDGFSIRQSGAKDGLYYSAVTTLKNSWPEPPVTQQDAGPLFPETKDKG